METLPAIMTQKNKGWWADPEKRTMLIFTGALIFGVVWFFGSWIGDYVTHALDNMIHFAVTLGALLLVLFIISDEKARRLFFFFYRALMRMITRLWCNIDPIGNLETIKEKMDKIYAGLVEGVGTLKGRRVEVLKKSAINDKELEKQGFLVKEAQTKGDDLEIQVEKRQYTRLTDKKERLDAEIEHDTEWINRLNRYQQICGFRLKDLGLEIESRKENRADAKAFNKISKGIKAIMNGMPDQDMWDESTKILEDEYNQALGDMENMMDMTKNIVDHVDLQDRADATRADALLAQWERKNSQKALPPVNPENIITITKEKEKVS